MHDYVPNLNDRFYAYQPSSRTLHIHNIIEPFIAKPHRKGSKLIAGNCLAAVGSRDADLWFTFDLNRWRFLEVEGKNDG